MPTDTKQQHTGSIRERGQALAGQGLHPTGTVHWNLQSADLMAAATRRKEGEFTDMGAFVARTAPHTGRSPNDKFVVRDPVSERDVDWGKVNQPISPAHFNALLADVRRHLDSSPELFVEDLHCGADPAYQLSVRYVSPNAWHMAFVRNMFKIGRASCRERVKSTVVAV